MEVKLPRKKSNVKIKMQLSNEQLGKGTYQQNILSTGQRFALKADHRRVVYRFVVIKSRHR